MAARYVLIGAGPGALAAAEAIRRADGAAELVAVAADPYGFYSRPGLAYYLTGELPRRRLFPFTVEEIHALGLTFVPERATRLDPAARLVTLQSGRRLQYDRLLLATGAAAIVPGVPGTDLDGVVKLDDMSDAVDIARRAHDARVAVVVGGGITALEIVEGLRARGVHVHYFLRREHYWSNVLSTSESRIVEQALVREGVELHQCTELAGVVGRDGRVTGVETGDGTRIRCGLVAIAVGVRPRTELASAAGLACGRGVLVDEHLRTSDPHVFAAGDVAEVFDERTGHRTLDVLWNVALAKGRVAGANMARGASAGGQPVRFTEGSPVNVTRLAGLKTTIMGTVGSGRDSDLQGLSRGDSQVWSELRDAALVEAGRGDAHIRLALEGGVIVGAVVMGDQTLSFPLQELVGARADVSRAVADLEAPGASVADIVTRLWDDWRARRA